MEITINGNVTINNGIADAKTTEAVQDIQNDLNEQGTQTTPVVNHDEDKLIDNETTFFGLLDILRRCPEAMAAEKSEREAKIQEAKQKKMKESLGDLYEDFVGDNGAHKDGFKKEKRRPGAVQLWNNYHRIAALNIGEDGRLDVYTNGYAVYDNGDRRTVVWVPDCGSATYYFTPLRSNEMDYLTQKESLGEDVFGPLPWYHALMVAGEDSIERNLEHPKSIGTTSSAEKPEEWEIKENHRWSCGAHFDSPEEAYLKKEAAEERRKALTEKQREAYVLYYEEGYTQEEVAKELGIDRSAVSLRLTSARKTFAADTEKFFSE